MKTSLKTFAIVIAALIFSSFELPKSWFAAGSAPKSYEMGMEAGAGQDGKNAATIQSKSKKVKGFGTLMQNCNPDKYLGKRVRMTGYVKSENVASWAGLWLRVDEKGSTVPLSFDNMDDRPIKATTAWTKYEIVLDVPNNASNLAYGALLSGTGKIWFDHLTFEVVDTSVPCTGEKHKHSMPLAEPGNLSFEE